MRRAAGDFGDAESVVVNPQEPCGAGLAAGGYVFRLAAVGRDQINIAAG